MSAASRELMLPCARLNHTRTQVQATAIPWVPADVPSYVSCSSPGSRFLPVLPAASQRHSSLAALCLAVLTDPIISLIKLIAYQPVHLLKRQARGGQGGALF